MIIDCHGHYTTAPPELQRFRKRLIEPGANVGRLEVAGCKISDDDIRASLEPAQIRLQRERGTNTTIFSPQASAMGHNQGGPLVSAAWARACNDLIYRVSRLYPGKFVGACQLPQAPGERPMGCIRELRRCVDELGFVACNLNPDPSAGDWADPPLSDTWWFPLYEALVELDVPAMLHVSSSGNNNVHTTGAYYLGADTTIFMQLLLSDVFDRFPTLRFIIPHGGGAVPYHWGRYRGIGQDRGRPLLQEGLLGNVFFDTCVYNYAGVRLLTEVIPSKNILFGSEMIGAVRGIDPETGNCYDDTRRYIDSVPGLGPAELSDIFSENALRVYPRLQSEIEVEREPKGVPQ